MQTNKLNRESKIKWQHVMLLLWLLVASMLNTYYKNKYEEQAHPVRASTVSQGS